MTTQTTNYSFTKDDINEPYDVLRVNANLDAIDTEIKKKETQIGDKANLVTVTKTNLVAAINEVKEQTNSLATNKADLVNGKIPSIQLPNIEVPVQSVNSKTGAVVLTKTDIGLGNVDNSVDSAKAVLSATKLATPRAINGVAFDGTVNITVADGTKAPTSHASTGTGYGIGTTANYGHVKTINALTQASHVDGTALSAYQGKVLNDNINAKQGKWQLLRTFTASQAFAPIGSAGSVIGSLPYDNWHNFADVIIEISGTVTLTNGNTSTTAGSVELGICLADYRFQLVYLNSPYNATGGGAKTTTYNLSNVVTRPLGYLSSFNGLGLKTGYAIISYNSDVRYEAFPCNIILAGWSNYMSGSASLTINVYGLPKTI